MDDKPSPNEDEIVKFTIIMTSDAARKEITMPISSTKLVDLKHKLAEDKYFGSKVAPVNRQRIFYLGRELKSGGRSLSNLGLGKYSNKILHLYIRPGKDEDDDTDIKEVFSTAASPRKRRRTAAREQNISSTSRRDTINNNSLSSTVRSASTHLDNTIEILESSDDDEDEVEIIEVL